MKPFAQTTASTLGILVYLLLQTACTTTTQKEVTSATPVPEEAPQIVDSEAPEQPEIKEETPEEPEVVIPPNLELSHEFVRTIQERLEVTDEQMDEMKPILLLSVVKQMKVMQKYGIPTDSKPPVEKPKIGLRKGLQLRSDIKEIQTETRNSLAPILSESQLKDYKAFQKEKNKHTRKKFRSQ